jgi:hypothetical protein
MAAAASFLASPAWASARLTTGVANTDGTGTLSTFTWSGSAPATDWMPVKLIISSSSATGVGDLADSLIHIFISDGTNIRRIRTIDPGNPAAGSTTVSEFQIETNFGPEFVMPSGCTMQVGVSVTPTAGNVDFVLFAQKA